MPATHNALPDPINDSSGTKHRRLLRGTSPMLCARVGNIVSLKDNGGSQDVPRKPAVLFACLGNICRSPPAEAAFRAEVVRIGLDVEVDSAVNTIGATISAAMNSKPSTEVLPLKRADGRG
jgi:hypothetical protein